MPSLTRHNEWRYLGINFIADGRCMYLPQNELDPLLDKLSKAPLKPQQRLHVLRVALIPQLYHKLILGYVMIGSLNMTDRMIRSELRGWLHLPKDAPTAFFHTAIAQGGLGIPSVRCQAPHLRKIRLTNIRLPNLDQVATANTFAGSQIDEVNKRLRDEGRTLSSSKDISTY